ncbi:hypothetical protein D9758_016220 [Tetrapyrgos nigripes]|uniref:Zinc finger PHD-type domain-containing protein n=1 Tax=Tetrapyrgos nigripes TaxID=182062 RepID=A0A8H5CL62_9AGAR|nr:hypothetical protein D9758_016220 [Tetrapyrgos nigripes]
MTPKLYISGTHSAGFATWEIEKTSTDKLNLDGVYDSHTDDMEDDELGYGEGPDTESESEPDKKIDKDLENKEISNIQFQPGVLTVEIDEMGTGLEALSGETTQSSAKKCPESSLEASSDLPEESAANLGLGKQKRIKAICFGEEDSTLECADSECSNAIMNMDYVTCSSLGCGLSYHLYCLGVMNMQELATKWFCDDDCKANAGR